MAKKNLESSAHGKRAKKSAKAIPDSQIDFSNIPELTSDQLKRGKRLGRPLIGLLPRQLVAIRLDQGVLMELKRRAKKSKKGYQTLINEVLSEFVGKKRAA